MAKSAYRTTTYATKDPVQSKHQRDMMMQVYLPFGVVVAVMILVLAGIVIAASPSSVKIGTIASFMSLLILVPTVVMCVIPYVLVVALAIAVRKLNVALPVPLARLRKAVHAANNGAYQVARAVSGPVIWLNMRVAWLESLITDRTDKTGSNSSSTASASNQAFPKALGSGNNVNYEK